MGYDYVIFGEDSSIEYGGSNTIPEADVLYMSHYFPWDDLEHYEVARECGFKDLTDFSDWPRHHWPDDFSQIDSIGYPVHLWLKYPKFGFQRVTDVATRRVRAGHWEKDKAEREITIMDNMLDPMALHDFCDKLGYTEDEFWRIVLDAEWNQYYKERLQ
jgi:hypothetical protein